MITPSAAVADRPHRLDDYSTIAGSNGSNCPNSSCSSRAINGRVPHRDPLARRASRRRSRSRSLAANRFEKEERNQVYASFQPASAERLTTRGRLQPHSDAAQQASRSISRQRRVQWHRVNLIAPSRWMCKALSSPALNRNSPQPNQAAASSEVTRQSSRPTFDGDLTITLGHSR